MYLVTGGAGFIGSNLVDALVADGRSVHVVDDLSTGDAGRVAPPARLHELDVRDGARLSALVREIAPDTIFHMAAQADVRRAVDEPGFDAAVNVIGTINVLEAARATGARVVFASTGGAAYGEAPDIPVPTPESVEPRPLSQYGMSKVAGEGYCHVYGRLHGVEAVVLRLANVYGPRQDPHGEAGVVAIFCNRILAGEAMTVFGDGEQTRDYVFVKDVARANALAATRPLPEAARLDARAFNVGTGVETTVLELAEQLQRSAGREVGVVHAPARPGEQLRSAVSVDRAREMLGWEPQATLADGLAETFAWFAERRAAVEAVA